MSSRHIRLWLVVAFTLFSAMLAGFLPPVPQNPAYHQFADARAKLP